jgi:hypothetical protein
MEEQSKYPVGSPGLKVDPTMAPELATVLRQRLKAVKSPLEKKMDLAKITDPKEREFRELNGRH